MSKTPAEDPFLRHFLPGQNTAMVRLRRTIARINQKYKGPPRMGRSVLLVGESGVGKNHVARVIAGHLYWLRDPRIWEPPGISTRPRTIFQVTAEHFAELALPNLPTELIESELFGHVKGAFTGASADKEGYFGADHIEDLLLDEIGDAQPVLQMKLLQVLNDGSFKRVGAGPDEGRSTEARILLATNRDLAARVRGGEFRSDLYWRIQHLVIRIPPLREQRDRIPILAEGIVAQILQQNGAQGSELRLPPADIDWARKQPWPGNVRELERLLWRWVYEEGTLSLREIQSEYPTEALDTGAGSISIGSVVRERVATAVERRERLAASVGDFARDVEREAQAALYALKRDLNLDRDALAALFGDGDRAAKQISAWREKARST